MSHLLVCPDRRIIQSFLLGQTTEAEAEEIELHLQQCPDCGAALEGLKSHDRLTDTIRAQETISDEPEQDVVVGLVARLKELPRPVDVAAGTLAMTPAPVPAGSADTAEVYDFLAPPRGPGEIGWLGSYRVLAVLGVGGMGVVFRAEDTQLRRPVALKVIRPALAAFPSITERLLREARALAALKHDHIATIYQVGQDGGVPYLAMELLEGEGLEAYLQRVGRLPLSEALAIARQIAEGLAAAHDHGLIHRDVKPANVWLETRPSPLSPRGRGVGGEGGRVKLLDFGLARGCGADAQITQSGLILGTPAFMAPEQARGETVDHRADLFSLGCILYRLVTGNLPFKGTDALSTLYAVTTEHPPAPRQLEPNLPPALNNLILCLLAKNVADRPSSARAVVKALEAIEHPPATAATPPVAGTVPAPRPRHSGGGRRRWIAAAVAAGLAATVMALVFVLRIKKEPDGVAVELKAIWDDDKPPEKPAPPVPTGLPLSPGALVRRPAKIPGVESISVETVEPRGEGSYVLSPDGQRVASFTADGSIRVWSTRGGELLKVLLGHEGFGMLAWSPDGQRLASGGYWDTTLRVWDISTGKQLFAISGAHSDRTPIAWSQNGKLLATIMYGPAGKSRVLLFDATTGEKVDVLTIENVVLCLAWRPSGNQLAVAVAVDLGVPVRLEIWDTEKGRRIKTLDVAFLHRGEGCYHLAWSHDEKLLAAVVSESKLHLCDVASGKVLRVIEGRGWLPAFSKDDKELFWGKSVWDVVSGKKLRDLQSERLRRELAREEQIAMVWSWSADGQYALGGSSSGSGISAVWDTRTGKIVWRRPVGTIGVGCGFSPDGQSLAMDVHGSNGRIWDLASGRTRLLPGGTSGSIRAAWSPDGKKVMLVSINSQSLLFDAASGTIRGVSKFTVAPSPSAAAWSPDSRTFAALIHQPKAQLAIWDTKSLSGEPRHILEHLKSGPNAVAFVALSPDGKRLASAWDSKTISIWDSATGKNVRRIGTTASLIHALSWSPNNKRLATHLYFPRTS